METETPAMPFLGTNRKLASILASPTLAVAVAFALRMLLLWLSHRGEDLAHPRFETVGLEAQLVALSLAAGKGFFGPYPHYPATTACLAPVYPFLLGVGDKLFHLHSFGSTVLGQVMNSAFSAATCWPIFSIGKRIFGTKIGLASAWLWVFLPYAVLLPLEWTWDQSLSALVLSLIMCATFSLGETPFGGTVPPSSQPQLPSTELPCTDPSRTGLLHTSPPRTSPQRKRLSLTGYGLLWAFAALVNPTLCILLPFLLIWWMVRRGPITWPSLAAAAEVLLIFVLALLPWTVRNYYAIDGLVFVKSNFGMELWLGNNPAVQDVFSPELHPAVNFGQLLSLIFNGESNYNRARQRQAIAYIKAHPRIFLKNVSDRFADTWAATYDSRVEPWIVALRLSRADVWFCLSFSIVSFLGMLLALRADWFQTLPLAMCLLLFRSRITSRTPRYAIAIQ
jgi:hypothetical protein